MDPRFRGEAPDVSNESHERGGDQQPDSRDGAEIADGRELLRRCLQLPLYLLDPGFDLADLATGLGKDRA